MHFLRILFLFILFLFAGCTSLPKVSVQSEYLNEPINTTVDSEIARYYLKHYLKGKRNNPNFDKKIDRLYESQQEQLPSRSELKSIALEFSHDFAALFFAEHIMLENQNKILHKKFKEILALSKQQLYSKPIHAASYQVVFVPGWNYVDNGYLTGSDLALPRKVITDLGIQNTLIQTPSNGSVEQSAKVLSKAILEQSTINKKIIVVGASAAGPAIHLTLGESLSHHQSKSVVAWINLGGILKGSPLVDYFQRWPQKALLNVVLWHKDWNNNDILSMSTEASIKRFNRLQLKPDMLVINYLALSLSGNLSHLSKYKYPYIMPEGPNDGLTLLTDVIAPNSSTLIAVNSDHYFGEDENINDKIVAIIKTMIYFLENP